MAQRGCELVDWSTAALLVSPGLAAPTETTVSALTHDISIHSLTEINIGLIVGCMPILPVLFQHEKGFKFVGKYFSSLRSQLNSFRSILRTKQSRVDEKSSKENHLTALPAELGLRHASKDSCPLHASKDRGEVTHDETSSYEPVTMV